VLYLALTPEGQIEWASRSLRDALGFDLTELIGTDFSRCLLPPDARAGWTQLLARLPETSQPVAEQISLLTRSGRTLDVEWRFWIRRDDGGRITRVEGFDVDSTSHRESQRWLIHDRALPGNSHEDRLGLLEYVADHVALVSPDGKIQYVNRAFETVSGIPRERAIGMSLNAVWAGRLDEQRLDEIRRTLSDGNVYRGEFVNRNANGELFYDEITITPLRSTAGKLKVFLAVGRDATSKRLSDPSTGLQTRALLLERVRLALARARRHGESGHFALLFIDVDRFKSINDTYGMSAGDQVILEISRRLNSAVRKIDAVAQVGHISRDEFAVLVEELTEPSDARNVAERLLQQLQLPITIAGNELVLSMSIGIASGTPDYQLPEELLRDAETAMSLAKQSPTESCWIFDQALHDRALVRVRLGVELRRALETDEIIVYYQPIVSLTGGTITGAEALVRWRHPTRGLVSPLEFIPAAEDSGLIVPLGLRVMRDACRQVVAWHAMGCEHLTVAVNVSLRQFRDNDFVHSVQQVLDDTGLRPTALKLELTESTAADDPDAVVRILEQLRALGVQTLMDDFGTGYSSLSYLTRLSLDKLKIDRSFIMRIPGSAHDGLVASSILVLAHNLGLGVIAEGVETEAQIDFLRQLGCDEIQGFLFSPPVPSADFNRLLAAGYDLASAVEKKRATRPQS